MYITITTSGVTRDMTINSNTHEQALRAIAAVERHVEALRRAKLMAEVNVYRGKAYTCSSCRGENDYGGFCACLGLEDKWVATWTPTEGWTEGWAKVRAAYSAAA